MSNQRPSVHELQPRHLVILAVLCGGFVALACLAALLFWLANKPTAKSSREAGQSVEAPKIDNSLSAQELFAAYCNNPAIADTSHKNKRIELTGYVVNLGKDDKGRYFIFGVYRPAPAFESIEDANRRINAASASGVQGVRCYLSDKHTVENGMKVTVQGRCVGMPLDVELRDCNVVRSEWPKR